MGHESWLVKGRLPVEHDVVAVNEVSVNNLILVVDQKIASMGESLLIIKEFKLDKSTVFLQKVGSRVVLAVNNVRL